MGDVLTFPLWAEARDRLAKIEAAKESAALDAEIAEIHARVDRRDRRQARLAGSLWPLHHQEKPAVGVIRYNVGRLINETEYG